MKHLFIPILIIIIAVTSAEAQELTTIASFTTSVAGQDESVKRNIFLACQKIDNYTIGSKSIFSFNKTVGEGSAVNGFVDGRVLYMDEVRYESGGGLCQVSSTLFNAFLMAGFVTIERYRHFQPVTYVPLGLDATIKYGKKDLRVRNPYHQPIHILASMNDKSLLVVLKAKQSIPYRYELVTDEEELSIPFAENYEQDVTVRNGITVYVYRRKFSKNKLIENQLLYRDYYPPVYLK